MAKQNRDIDMQTYFTKIKCLIGLILFSSSCANYKLHQVEIAKDLTRIQSDEQNPITHSIYLIGDVGNISNAKTNPTLQLLKKHLDQAGENSSVLFLGNNVSAGGMPPKSKKKERQEAENQLNAQLDILTNFNGHPIFLPGNQDWKRYGVKGLKRQEKYIESALNKGKEEEFEDEDWHSYFLPDGGCAGPEVIEISDDLVIIIIDSQWWLLNWDEEPNVNEGCHVKSREEFALLMESTIKDHKKKNIVFASHHSFKSVGPRGGTLYCRQSFISTHDSFKKCLCTITWCRDIVFVFT